VSTEDFFEESTEQSRVKAAIVAKYFWAWAKIVLKKQAGRIAYVDLFSGPGKYRDSTKSTPLLVLERAISDSEMRKRLVTIFNDSREENVAALTGEIRRVEGIERLKHYPVVEVATVGDETVKALRDLRLIPTLLFADPWGYKGLSLELLKTFLKNWGCDCLFFFNYNRINPGLANDAVKAHMDALFGVGHAEQLRRKIDGMPPREREAAIVEELCDALRELGAKYVLPFCFKDDRGVRTSHHLVFVTKHPLGYGIMKDIMATASSERQQGVASFGYCPASAIHPLLFELNRPLDDLEQMLLREFSGQTLSKQEIYDRHNVGRPYTMKNYRSVLLTMEANGLIQTEPPRHKRRKNTLPDYARVTFPKSRKSEHTQ